MSPRNGFDKPKRGNECVRIVNSFITITGKLGKQIENFGIMPLPVSR